MTDIRDVDPKLTALQNNGGATPTHALLATSPARDAGRNSLTSEPFDQRGAGYLRIRDANGDGIAIVDIGAYEQQIATAASVTVQGRVMSGKRGVSQVKVYLTDQSGETRTALTNSFGYYRFDGVQTGATYVFNAVSKQAVFNPRVITINDEETEVNLHSVF